MIEHLLHAARLLKRIKVELDYVSRGSCSSNFGWLQKKLTICKSVGGGVLNGTETIIVRIVSGRPIGTSLSERRLHIEPVP